MGGVGVFRRRPDSWLEGIVEVVSRQRATFFESDTIKKKKSFETEKF